MVWYKPIRRQTGGAVPAAAPTAFQTQGQTFNDAVTADPNVFLKTAAHQQSQGNWGTNWADPNVAADAYAQTDPFLYAQGGNIGDYRQDVSDLGNYVNTLNQYGQQVQQEGIAGRAANLAAQQAGFADAAQARAAGFDAAAAARSQLGSDLRSEFADQIAGIPQYDDSALTGRLSALENRPEYRYDDTGLTNRLSALENATGPDLSQFLTAADLPAQQDISGIANNAAQIQALQNAGYLTAADLPVQQDISGIGANQQRISQLQNQIANLPPQYDDSGLRQELAALQSSIPAQQDISGIANNAAAIEALRGQIPQQQDISGIANNAAAIQALQNAPQQDISGIASNNALIQSLQQQIADMQANRGGNRGGGNRPDRPDRPQDPRVPRDPRGPRVGGRNTPITNTGIVDQGAARPYIDDYFAGNSPFGQLDFSGFQGTQGGGASNYGYAPVQQQAPAPVPTPTPTPTPTPPPAPPAPPVDTTPTGAETYGEYGSGVSDEAQEIREQYVDPELPFDPFDQADKAAGTSWGGGVDEVIAAREDPSPELEPYIPPPAPAPGVPKEEAHQVVEDSFETFGEALNNPELKPEEVAAANPAFNPEIALAAAENPVTIETPAGETYTVPARDLNSVDANAALGTEYSAGVDDFGYIDPFGGTAPTNGGTNAIAEKAEQDAKAAGASDTEAKAAGTEAKKKAERKQYEILGNSVLAAGVSNIGGKFNQSGENQGLKDDWLIVGDSKGGQEVWAPDGKTYDSVEDAKKAGGSKDKKKEPSVRDKALVRAAEIAKAMADKGESKKERSERLARQAEEKARADKAAAERQAKLDSLDQPGKDQFRADEAIQSRDRGDLKNLMREFGIKYKKDDSSTKLINKLKAGMAKRQAVAPPPATVTPPPPPQPQVTPRPTPPPQPTPQVTPAPTPPPAAVAPPPPPKPVEEVTPEPVSLPPAIQNVNTSNAGSMKAAIYAARKAGIPIKSGSLRKKSNSELRRMLQQAGLA